ncbi:MAG TPA: hypothetical protein VFH95_07145 [Candidatus Kapabacteria bacterium]|nr:hypothetical protein [Candidatus Kapabacteria bacterium]
MFGITPVHLHLLLNHLPVVGSIASVMLLLYAMARKNAELKRAALIAFVLTGLAAYATDYTGDGAEHVAKNIPGVERQKISDHADAGDTAMDVSLVLGAIALLGLILAWRKPGGEQTIGDYVQHHKEPHKWIMIACLVIGLVDIYFVSIAAYKGGLIRHPEIQSGYQPPAAAPATPQP